jgi:hypothetical protein
MICIISSWRSASVSSSESRGAGASGLLSSQAHFSLVGGGPTHRLQQRLGLITPESPHLARRAVLSMLLTWFPLLVLSAVQGRAIGHDVSIPFLYDFADYARFLAAIPLLILAEGWYPMSLWSGPTWWRTGSCASSSSFSSPNRLADMLSQSQTTWAGGASATSPSRWPRTVRSRKQLRPSV